MRRRAIALIALAGVVGLPVALLATRAVARAGSPESEAAATIDPAARDRDIAFYLRRVQEDSLGAEDRARLAALYLQRGREGGDLGDYARAESLAVASVQLREDRNGRAMLLVASSRLALHDFAGALKAADRLVALDSTEPGYAAIRGEIQLELGLYAAAETTFNALLPHGRHLAVAPRLARWKETRGAASDAAIILRQAARDAADRPDLPAEQRSWFHVRVADAALRNGRLDEARSAIEAGLRIADDPRLVAARMRWHAARGDWPAVLEDGETLGDDADVAGLALRADAFEATGDRFAAAAMRDAADALGVSKDEPFNRQLSQLRVEHRRDLDNTVALLRREFAERPDHLGRDLFAWGLYQQGRFDEAESVIAPALAAGYRDATAWYHAGMIARARGESAVAHRRLTMALSINPAFDRRGAATARALVR